MYEILEHKYQEWLLEMGYIEDFPSTGFFCKLKIIPSSQVKHIIGRGGRILRELEIFTRVFASMADTKEGVVLSVVGRLRACLLDEFIVDMILEGKYSIMESLFEHGF